MNGSKRVLLSLCMAMATAMACGSETPDVRGSGTTPGQNARLQVVIDQSKDQISSPFGTGFEGLSRLTLALRERGVSVGVNHENLEPFLADFCAPGHVLVLGIPWKQRYAVAEREAVRSCLAAGSGVLVLVEHDDIYGHATIQNELIEPFGIRALPVSSIADSESDDPFDVEWPWARADRFGVRAARVFLPAPLELSSGARPLLELLRPAIAEHAVVGAVTIEAGGPLVVLGDLEIFWNMTPDAGLRAGDNLELTLALFALLAGREAALPDGPAKLTPPEAWSQGTRRALFERTGGALVPDGTPNGLDALAAQLSAWGYRIEIGGGAGVTYEDFDVVVVAVPLAPLEAPERILRARRILLIADGEQDLLAAEPALERLLPLDFAAMPRTAPLEALAEPLGIELPHVTLLSRDSRLEVAGQWSSDGAGLRARRSGTLLAKDDGPGAALAVVARAEQGTSATWLLSPVQSGEQDTDPRATPERPAFQRFDRPSPEAWPLIVRGSNVMALADLELVTSHALTSHSGRRLASELERWLASPTP